MPNALAAAADRAMNALVILASILPPDSRIREIAHDSVRRSMGPVANSRHYEACSILFDGMREIIDRAPANTDVGAYARRAYNDLLASTAEETFS